MNVWTGSSAAKFWVTGGGLALLLTVAHLFNDALSSMLSALLPTLQERFGLSESWLAFLVATFAFSSSVTQPLFGALSDRFGRRALAAFGLVLSVSLLSLMAVAPSVWTLLGLLLVGGLGSAAFHPSGTGIARSSSVNKELAVSLFSAGGMLGLAMGPVIVLIVASGLGLGYTPWLMVPGIVLGILINLIAPARAHAPEPARRPLEGGRLLRGPVGRLVLVGTLLEVAFTTFASAFPLWLVAERGLARDSTLLGWTLTVFFLAAALGGVTGSLLSQRWGRSRVVTLSLLAAPLPLLATFAAAPGSAAFFGWVLLAGLLTNMAFPLLIVSAQDLAPRSEATASGMLMGLTVGLAGLLYVGVGRLQEAVGMAPAMALSYLALLPAALLARAAVDGRPAPAGGAKTL